MIFLKFLNLLIQHHDIEHCTWILKMLFRESSKFLDSVRTPSPNQIDVEITNFILHFFDQILHGRLGVVELRLSHARYTSLSFILPGMDILQNVPWQILIFLNNFLNFFYFFWLLSIVNEIYFDFNVLINLRFKLICE